MHEAMLYEKLEDWQGALPALRPRLPDTAG
jgi:hypothetical protein